MTPIAFDLQIEGFDPGAIQVVRIAGEETLTRPYRFDVDVVSSQPDLPLEDVLATTATLSLTRGDDRRVIHGVILEASESNEAMGGSFAYRMTLVPRISLLALSRHNRTFATAKPLSVLEVVQSVLADPLGLGLGPDDWAISVRKPEDYPKRDFWAQYDESDFDFVHRLLEHWGIVYYFEQTDSHERIVFTDATTLAPAQEIDGTLTFSQETRGDTNASGIVRSVVRRLQSVSKTVQLNDYNDQTPQSPVTARSDVPNGLTGAYFEYATHFLNQDEGKIFAQARAEEIGCTRDVFALSSDSPFTTPGVTFALRRHFRPSFNQSYLPTAVRHTGHQYIAGAFWAEAPETPSGYRAEITAIPSAVAYRSPRRLPRPVMAGVMPAKVDAPQDAPDRAVLDEQGRYKVVLDFDTTENQPYQKSNFLRMAQPYGGANTGLHFPLLKDTEVIIGWLDGDPDRPLILGAVPNTLNNSPVTKTNETQNKILTTAGIAVIMNDGPGTPAAAGGEPQTPPAQAPTAATDGVYAATAVPAAEGSLPHYERSGVVAVDEDYETKIIADPSFQAGTVDYRGTALTNADYEGIFSYTPDHRTTTTGGNETTVVNGDQRIWVGGNSTTFVAADEKTWWEKLFATASVDSKYFSASVYKTPKISYYDTEYMSVYNLLTLRYAFGVDLRVLANVAGTFQHRVGASLTLSGSPLGFVSADPTSMFAYGTKPYGSSYSLSTSGYTYKQIAGVDKSHCIFGTDKIVLGFRGNALTGTATMTALTAIANTASNFALVGLTVAELAQALLWVDDKTGTPGQAAMLALELAAVTPVTWAYVKAIRTVVDYFNAAAGGTLFPNQKDLTANGQNEGTVTIDAKGVTLTTDTAKIAVANAVPASNTPTQITLSVGPNSSITIRSDEIIMTSPKVTITGTDKVIVKANDATTAVVASAGNKVTLGGDKISLAAPTSVSDKLTVQTGGCTITGQLKATTAQIG